MPTRAGARPSTSPARRRELSRAGAGGMHLEDQVQAKRCGHRPGKALVGAAEMADRIKAAVDGRDDDSFVIMARTDAHAVEGQAAAIERAQRYVAAGADMIFAEALATLDEYRQFTARRAACRCSRTSPSSARRRCSPSRSSRAAGVGLVLYPLSAFRAMSRAAETVYGAIRTHGTQQSVVDSMQTRAELYDVLGYHDYEQQARRAVREGNPSHERSNSRRSSRRNPSRCPASSPATPRCAPSAQRQRPALPRLRHPRPRRRAASSRRSRTC